MVEPSIWKICDSQIGVISPRIGGENSKNMDETTTQQKKCAVTWCRLSFCSPKFPRCWVEGDHIYIDGLLQEKHSNPERQRYWCQIRYPVFFGLGKFLTKNSFVCAPVFEGTTATRLLVLRFALWSWKFILGVIAYLSIKKLLLVATSKKQT